MKLFLAMALMLLGSYAVACQFNTDCNVGSTCLKQGNSLYGACVGGLNPGNSNDRKPSYNPLDLNRGSLQNPNTGDARRRMDSNGTYGDTCSFSTQCGVGSQCVKSVGSITGTCM